MKLTCSPAAGFFLYHLMTNGATFLLKLNMRSVNFTIDRFLFIRWLVKPYLLFHRVHL